MSKSNKQSNKTSNREPAVQESSQSQLDQQKSQIKQESQVLQESQLHESIDQSHNYDEQQNETVVEDIKDKNAAQFKQYMNETGLSKTFSIIFAEILEKKVDINQVYAYTAMRLRQIGTDIQNIQSKMDDKHKNRLKQKEEQWLRKNQKSPHK